MRKVVLRIGCATVAILVLVAAGVTLALVLPSDGDSSSSSGGGSSAATDAPAPNPTEEPASPPPTQVRSTRPTSAPTPFPPFLVGNPCTSYGKVVTVEDAAAICDRFLEPDTAYVMTTNVTCDGDGPRFKAGSCLDCRGHRISGVRRRFVYGLTIDAGASSSSVHNCVVSNFGDGIHVEAENTAISNVEVVDNFAYGVWYKAGSSNNLFACSVVRNNGGNGLSSSGSTRMESCLVEGNGKGVLMAGNDEFSCSEVRYNVDGVISMDAGFFPDYTRRMEHIVSHNNTDNVLLYYTPNLTMSVANVASCNGAAFDLVYEMSEANDFNITTSNMTCDSFNSFILGQDEHDSPSLCESPCPADPFSLSLSPACSDRCPDGRGSYIPEPE